LYGAGRGVRPIRTGEGDTSLTITWSKSGRRSPQPRVAVAAASSFRAPRSRRATAAPPPPRSAAGGSARGNARRGTATFETIFCRCNRVVTCAVLGTVGGCVGGREGGGVRRSGHVPASSDSVPRPRSRRSSSAAARPPVRGPGATGSSDPGSGTATAPGAETVAIINR